MTPTPDSAMTRRNAFLFASAFAVGVLCIGCSTPSLPLSMEASGEFKLTEVSKIALIEFNTLPNDPFTGTSAADQATCALVQRAVSAAFSRSGMWKIARLDAEEVAGMLEPGVIPSRRFDAIAYGRVWWQYPDEYDSLKPEIFTLETKTRIKYRLPKEPSYSSSGSSSSGSGFFSTIGKINSTMKSIDSGFDNLFGESSSSSSSLRSSLDSGYETVDLVTLTQDVLEMVGHRSREAMLMLALSIYRVSAKGVVEKIADTFVALDQTHLLENGQYESRDASFGAPGAGTGATAEKKQEGSTELPANVATIPSDLQAKLMLAARAAEDLGRRIAPHKVVRKVTFEFEDEKLLNLLRNRAYVAAEQYALRTIRFALGAEVADKVEPLIAYGKPDYEVPPSSSGDIAKVSNPDANASVAAVERLVENNDCVEALFALAICQEATGRYDEALYTYRYVFRIAPEAAPAEGIARCHEALDAAARIAEQKRARIRAHRRASLE